MRIGFVGLGRMGTPMAKRLIESGHELLVSDIASSAESQLVSWGAFACRSLKALASDSQIVFTMLPGPKEVEDVVLGSAGILKSQAPGSIFVDMSTSTPNLARRIAEEGRLLSIGVLDAPVSGGASGAARGELSIMVGGEPDDFERALPLLRCMGTKVVRIGTNGSGQILKAANQLLIAGNSAILSEAIVFLERMKIDLNLAFDVLGEGLASSDVMRRRGRHMADRQFETSHGISMYRKDLGIVEDLIAAEGLTLDLASTITRLFLSLQSRDVSELDYSAVIKAVEAKN